jgi:endoglucanase
VASTFKTNHAVVFDLFNEPYDPTDPTSGDDQNSSDKVSWNCWETGTQSGPDGGAPCYTAAYDENNTKTTVFRIAGLETLVNAVRKAGAKQPVLTGGLDFANDLGDGDHGRDWLDHAPEDPLHQAAASFHNYMGKACDNATCWKKTIAPVAAHVPVVTGEFDEDNFDEIKCNSKTPSTFDARYMNWADSAGVSYLAWGWMVESQAERDADRCSAFYLIDNYTKYTPAQPNGVAIHTHLRALASGAGNRKPPVILTRFRATVKAGDASVGFALRSAETSKGTLSGKTVHPYGSRKPHQISLGDVHFTLHARRSKTAVLKLSRPARKLLLGKRSLKVRITITLTSAEHRRTITHRTVTLKFVPPHRGK